MIRTALDATSHISRTLLRGWNRQAAVIAAVYFALYIMVDGLSYAHPVLKPAITPWNPQAGLTLAFLLIYGPRWLPVTAAAAFLSEILIRAEPATSPVVVAAALWIALAYGGLAALLRRWELAGAIRTTIDAARLAGISVGATLVVAVGYVGLFVAARELSPADAMPGIARYWFGDLNGILMLTPLLIHATLWRESLRLLQQHRWEMLAQCASVILTLLIIFGLPAMDQLRFFYLLFVPVIWIALRWSWPGALLAVLAAQIALIIAARIQIPTPRFVDLQYLMLTLSLTALLLGAVVTERAGVLRRVARREAEQRALLAMAPDGVLAVDASGDIRMANTAAIRLFGERAGAQQAPRISALLPGLHLDTAEGRKTLDGRREDGGGFPAEIAWARLGPTANEGFLVTVRDATDRRRAEEQLRERDAALARAMRFAVAGELASALAHELNQPITALVSYLGASEILAARCVGEDDRLQRTLVKATHEAVRASDVLRRLRDFYRGGALKRETVHVPAVCTAVVRAFQDRLRRADVSLVVSVDPSIPKIEGDGTQLEIVLHNLLANAVDAVTQEAGPWRRVELHATWGESAVTVRVEDSGPGIAADVSQKLFEPFVTSKPDGMGLGLAISRSLIRARGGELSFAPSAKLGGASFTLRLPIEIPPDTPLI
jgi:signal transduction histidine kinase